MKKIFLLIVLSSFLIVIGCQNKDVNEVNEEQAVEEPQIEEMVEKEFEYKSYDIKVDDRPFLGSSDATNEMLFVFDYKCPWCTKWMNEVFPTISENYIDSNTLKFTSLPISFLGEASDYLSQVDSFIKKFHPELYFEIQHNILQDFKANEQNLEEYIKNLLNSYDIVYDETKIVDEQVNILTFESDFVRNNEIGAVPTLFVNGIKLLSNFSLEEINRVIKGEIEEGDIVKYRVKKDE